MPQDRFSTLSTEYVSVPVKAERNHAIQDLTSFSSFLSFVPAGTSPQSTDWKGANWELFNPTGFTDCLCLVGPDGGQVILAPGEYFVWVKINATPETVIRRSGTIKVY